MSSACGGEVDTSNHIPTEGAISRTLAAESTPYPCGSSPPTSNRQSPRNSSCTHAIDETSSHRKYPPGQCRKYHTATSIVDRSVQPSSRCMSLKSCPTCSAQLVIASTSLLWSVKTPNSVAWTCSLQDEPPNRSVAVDARSL